MRILTTSFYYYNNDTRAVEPQFYYLFRVPEQMGHEVDFFDWVTAAKIGVEHMRRVFLTLVKSGKYDVVFIATYDEEFDRETLAEAQRYCPVIAWNSDDEYRWDSYTSKRADWYTYMVTNSPTIYEREKPRHPNMLHAQWACTGFWDGRATPKDIAFSFAGQIYGKRADQIRWLNEHADLQAFGMGVKDLGLKNFCPDIKLITTISFEQVNALWNRTKVSFTPLDALKGNVRQIKSRIFDMGLSGTLMLAHNSPDLERYYEAGKECVTFETLEECAEKARYYLTHEAERQAIVEAYAKRTLAENMWEHRIRDVLRGAGLDKK